MLPNKKKQIPHQFNTAPVLKNNW